MSSASATDPGAGRLDEAPLARGWLVALLVFAVAVAAFAVAIEGPFLYDDLPLIAHNPVVGSLSQWRAWWSSDLWNSSGGGPSLVYWRPLLVASYAFDWAWGGGSPVAFHITNLVLHGVGAVLAYETLRRWSGAERPALAAALLLAVHPTRAECVAWIAGRADVLCYVAALVACAGAARRMRGERRAIALEALATFAAYAAKEQAVVLPAFIAVERWSALGRPALDRGVATRVLRSAVPQLGVALVYLAARARWLPIHAGSALHGAGATARVETVLETLGRTFELTFFPRSLSVQQGQFRSHYGEILFVIPYVVAGAVGLVALIAAAVLLRRRAPTASLGLAFYGATLLPTSNIVPSGLQTLMSERFLYLPLLGIALAACALFAAASRALYAAALVGCVSFVASVRRADDFTDANVFWEHELALHPNSPEANRQAIRRAGAQLDLPRALALAASAHDHCIAEFTRRGCDVEFIVEGLEVALRLTPDRDVAMLRAVDSFAAEALDPARDTAKLEAGSIRGELALHDPVTERSLRALAPRLWGLRASVASRLGDDPAALSSIARARESCADCGWLLEVATLVEARAGRYDDARADLERLLHADDGAGARAMRATLDRAYSARRRADQSEGPIQSVLRAEELSLLEAWGRGYAIVSPHRAAFIGAPGLTMGFARLAWSAGDFAVAREVLAGIVPASRVEPITREWSEAMGWVRPRASATPTP